MPRRSRPSYRLPPNKEKKTEQLEKVLSKPKHQSKTETKVVDSEDEARLDDELSSEEFEEGPSQWPRDEDLGDSDEEEVDADAPRIAIWEEDNADFIAQQDVEENEMSDEVRLLVLSASSNLTQGTLFFL